MIWIRCSRTVPCVRDARASSVERGTRRVRAALPESIAAGEIVTLEVRPPRGMLLNELTIAGEDLLFSKVGSSRYFRSSRFPITDAAKQLLLVFAPNGERQGPRSTLDITLQRWALPKDRR